VGKALGRVGNLDVVGEIARGEVGNEQPVWSYTDGDRLQVGGVAWYAHGGADNSVEENGGGSQESGKHDARHYGGMNLEQDRKKFRLKVVDCVDNILKGVEYLV
jgi:hypothetical protein